MKSGLVSVVCVNWNGEAYIERTLTSVLNQSYKPVEIIVVDNLSSDKSVNIIKTRFPQVRMIETGTNLGWPAGLNAGIEASSGEYVVPINNDLWMDDRCIEEMVLAVNKDPRFGSVASKVYLDKDKSLVEVAGVGVYLDGSSYARGRLEPKDHYNAEEEVFCASDCCCLYRKSMLDEIGPYDGRFFLYAEETEMGWRYQLAGWRCIYTPRAIAFHEHSASSKGYSPMKAFHVERNRIWVAVRYYPLWMVMFVVPWFSFYRYAYQVILSVRGKSGSLTRFRENYSVLACLRIIIKVHLAAFRHLPHYFMMRAKTPVRISAHARRDIFRKYGCSTKDLASYE